MDPAPARDARRVHWVTFSQGEAKSGLPFMMAICRPNGILHWLLRPMMNLMDPEKIGYFSGGNKLYRESGFQEEFGLSKDYPWFIGSRRAVGVPQKHLADGGSRLASPEEFSEPFFCFFRRLARTLIALGDVLLRCPPTDSRRSSQRLVS